MRNACNFVGFQICWFSTVLSAGAGKPAVGLVVCVIFWASHVAIQQAQVREALLLLACGVLGYLCDSVLVVTGILRFPEYAQWGWPSTVWMVALWVNLAATLNHSLAWLGPRHLLTAAFGLLGGPLAYKAGASLGALELSEPTFPAMLAVAVEWGVAMPLLFLVARATASKKVQAEEDVVT